MRFRTGTFLISWMRLGKPRKNVTCPGRTARTWAEAIDNEEALPGYSAVQPRDTFLLLCNQWPREMICTLREGEDCVCFAYHLWSFVLSPQQALINIWWVGERRNEQMNKRGGMVSILHRRTRSSDSPDNKTNTKWWVETTPLPVRWSHDLLKDQRQKLLLGKERKSVCPEVHSLFLCPFKSSLFYLSTSLYSLYGKQSLPPNCCFSPSALSAISPASLPGLSVFLFANCISDCISRTFHKCCWAIWLRNQIWWLFLCFLVFCFIWKALSTSSI